MAGLKFVLVGGELPPPPPILDKNDILEMDLKSDKTDRSRLGF